MELVHHADDIMFLEGRDTTFKDVQAFCSRPAPDHVVGRWVPVRTGSAGAYDATVTRSPFYRLCRNSEFSFLPAGASPCEVCIGRRRDSHSAAARK